MDRVIIYPGQVPLETDLLQTNKFAMIALSKLAAAVLGTATLVNGLSTVPTGPASLSVNVNPGEIYSLQNIDGTPYSSIAADTTHSILKQGISLDVKNLACAAPGSVGQSINYLIQATYADSDTGSIVLPYYNASNPAVAYSGPGGTGVAQNTLRQGLINVTAKAGVAATTGSQVTPAPDAGYVGLYVVTVANGQTTITSGNISTFTGAPIIAETLTQKIGQAAGDVRYLNAVQGARKNLKIAAIGVNNTNAVITVDELVLETSAGLYKTVKNLSLTVNSAGTVGQPLSLSTGVLAASTFYSVWVWDNGSTTTATIDPSATAPTAPAGYTNGYRARVGAVVTDSSGSKYLMNTLQVDKIASYIPLLSSNTASCPVASSGTVGAINSTLVAVSLTGLVPATATRVEAGMNAASGGSVQVAMTSVASITGGGGQTESVASGNNNLRVWLPLASTSIYWASAGSLNNLTIDGWEDSI